MARRVEVPAAQMPPVGGRSLFRHEEKSLVLFGVLKRTDNHTMDDLPNTPLMKKWWAYMADIMDTNPDNSPVAVPLKPVFYMA